MPDVQILAWLKAKARLTDAEEQLLKAKRHLIDTEEQHWSVLDADQWVSSLRGRSSMTFGQKSWPDGSTVGAALQECREAELVFDQADAALSPADRRLLKSVPDL